ncbi:MFS transporter [Actinomadura miaoliensis]|uniref:MFS transporter n=1 Tax=Actinomadura miaoliensis TaxID=430685 RepID=A0ABP7WDD7_9ACTN
MNARVSRGARRRALGLVFLLLPTFLLTVDLGVLWLATPPLTADLAPTSTQLLWINDVYGLVVASLLVLAGNLGDRFGRRRLLLLGVALFMVASLVAAYAPSPEVLIAGRAMLGAASAAIVPSTLALISNMFTDPRRRARAIALWVTALSSGIAVGPAVSGIMLEYFWWGSVFLLGVPVMAATLVVTPLTVPEHADPHAPRLDVAGMPLLLGTLLPFVYAIKSLGEDGPGAVPVAALAVAAASGTAFVRRQRRVPNPLIDLRLFADRTFGAALLLLFVGLAAMNSVEYLAPQYLRLVADVPSARAGLLTVLPAIGLAVGSQATPVLARRMRPAYVVAVAAVPAIIAFLGMLALPADGSGVVLAALTTTVMMVGLAPITVLGTDIAVGAAPPAKAGQAASIGQTAYELGLAFGIAATGSVMAAVYRGHVRAEAPAGVPAHVVDEAAGSIGGAVLAERAGAELTAVVRAAFTAGFHVAALVGAALTVLLLVLSVVLLRHVGPLGRPGPRAAEPAGREPRATRS